MLKQLQEKKTVLLIGGLILILSIVNLVMYILTYTSIQGETNKLGQEVHDKVMTSLDAWLVQKLCILFIVFAAAVTIVYFDFRVRTNKELVRFNWATIFLSLVALFALIIKLAGVDTLSSINDMQNLMATTTTWKFEGIDNARTFAYVSQSIDIINIITFTLGVGTLSMLVVHLHKR